MNRKSNFAEKRPGKTQQPKTSERIQRLLFQAQRACEAGQLAVAEQLCLQILAIDVRSAEGLHLLGFVGYRSRRFEMAIRMIGRAIAVNHKQPHYHSNLGNAFLARGKLDQAVASYGKALTLNPDLVEAHSNLGNALLAQNKLEMAVVSYRHALALNPNLPEAHLNLSNALRTLGNLEEALASSDRVLALKPGYVKAHSNRGAALHALGKLDEALASYDQALAIDPNNVDASWNRSLVQLLQGDFAAGWRNYEWRNQKSASHHFPQPQWRGEPLQGSRILLHCEQGWGDDLQFLRLMSLPLSIAK